MFKESSSHKEKPKKKERSSSQQQDDSDDEVDFGSSGKYYVPKDVLPNPEEVSVDAPSVA